MGKTSRKQSFLYTETVTLKINVQNQPFLNQYQSDSSSLELIDLQSRNPFTDQSLHTVQSAASLCLLNLFLRGAGSLIDKQRFSLIKGLSETSTQLDSPVNHTISWGLLIRQFRNQEESYICTRKPDEAASIWSFSCDFTMQCRCPFRNVLFRIETEAIEYTYFGFKKSSFFFIISSNFNWILEYFSLEYFFILFNNNLIHTNYISFDGIFRFNTC